MEDGCVDLCVLFEVRKDEAWSGTWQDRVQKLSRTMVEAKDGKQAIWVRFLVCWIKRTAWRKVGDGALLRTLREGGRWKTSRLAARFGGTERCKSLLERHLKDYVHGKEFPCSGSLEVPLFDFSAEATGDLGSMWLSSAHRSQHQCRGVFPEVAMGVP